MNWRNPAVKLRNYLFHKELKEIQDNHNHLASLQDSAVNKLVELEELIDGVKNRRLTLEDLQLTPTEQLNLKSCNKAFRHALWKSGEHICLTAQKECCRKTAVDIREYQRRLTLTEKNKVKSIDETIQDVYNERSKNYFKRNADS